MTITDLQEHLHIVARPCLKSFFLRTKLLKAVVQFIFDRFDNPFDLSFRHDKVFGWINGHLLHLLQRVTRCGIDYGNPVDFIPKQFYAISSLFVGGEYLYNVPAYPQCATNEIDIVPLILDANELSQKFVP